MSHSLVADGINKRWNTVFCSSDVSPNFPSLSSIVSREALGNPEHINKRGRNPIGAVSAARLAMVSLLAFASMIH